ncbi:MAG: hypothetical protein ACJ796_07390 [Gemmatimonadaceae bacterium]
MNSLATRFFESLSPRARWWLLAAVLLALVVASSGRGIFNDFAYDDVYVIKQNGTVHSLHHWWKLFARSYWPRFYGSDGYRPITMLAFATEWVVGNGAAWTFHATNIVLYAAVTVAVFWLATLLLPPTAAWLVAAVFAVHPVHVEAVANIVGQSELWVALFVLIAVITYLRPRLTGDVPSVRARLGICLCYALGLFSKEHAIVLPALLVGIELLLARDSRSPRARLALVRPLVLWLGLVASLYLAARAAVKHGEISGFQPFIVFQALDLSYANRVLTMIGVVPHWVRLLLWPARLSTEYAPPYVDVAQGPSVVQLPGLLMLIGIIGLGVVLWKRRGVASVASFGIVWICLTLLPSSNFIIPAGIILAERTLFLPSVGALLALGAVVPWLTSRLATMRRNDVARGLGVAAVALVLAILTAGTWKSSTRTPVWHDNERLFSQALVDAPQSYRAHYMLAAWMFETKRKKEGEHHYRRALALFPYDPFMSYNLAMQYQMSGMYAAAIPLYRWTFDLAPHFREGEGRENFAICLANMNQVAEAREQALIAMQYGGASLKDLRRIVQFSDSTLGKVPGARARTKRPVAKSDKVAIRKVLRESQFAGMSDIAKS